MIKKAIFVRIKNNYSAMQLQEGFKKFLPHLLVFAVFIAFSCAFCYPAFKGRIIDQHDVKTFSWGYAEALNYYEQTGESTPWINNMFSGMPQAKATKNNWFSTFGQMFYGGTGRNPATYFLLAMLSFYVLMCTLKINRWLGAIGAIAFAFSTYNPTIITAGHITKFLDIIFIPGIMAGIIIAYRGKYLAGSGLTGLFLAFSLDNNHLQIIYYTIFVVVAMVAGALVKAIKDKQFRSWFLASLSLAMAAVFAFLTCASNLLQTKEYSTYSIRGGKGELTLNGKVEKSTGLDKDYAFSWSNGAGEVFSMLVPNLYGGSIKENIGEDSHFGQKLSELGASPDGITAMTTRAPLYWGPQPMITGSAYFGAVICLLFVLSLFVIRSRYKWWLVGVAVLFVFISMGKHFSTLNYFLFDYLPGFNKFRSPNMATAITSVIFPMLGIWALKDIFEDKISKEELWKKLKLSLIITGGLCLLLLICTQTVFDYKGERDAQMEQQYKGEVGKALVKALREDRASSATSDAFRSLIFVLLAGGVLWAYSKNKTGKNTSIAALGLLIVIDLIPVGHRWLNDNDFMDADQYQTENFQPGPADAQILKDPDPYYRVFDISSGDPFAAFGEGKPSYFHKSIGGYSGIKMQIYQDLIENQIGKLNSAVLNMLNTKYFILPGQNGQPIAQQNPGALGNAWFVSDVKWVKTANEEMLALNAPAINNPMDSTAGNFNPAQTVVLRETYKGELGNYTLGKDPAAYVKLVQGGYTPPKMKFESNNTQPGLAVFSDIYYPLGWKATIDGKETPIMRADYALRAIKVPAGKHIIEFEFFDTPAFVMGNRLSILGSILLLLLIIAGIYFVIKNGKKEIAPVIAEPENTKLPNAKK